MPAFLAQRGAPITSLESLQEPQSQHRRTWTDRASFERCGFQRRAKCKVLEMDLRPGGSFVTQISENGGDFMPRLSNCLSARSPCSEIQMIALQFVETSQLSLAVLRKSWWLNLKTRRIAALIRSRAEIILSCRREISEVPPSEPMPAVAASSQLGVHLTEQQGICVQRRCDQYRVAKSEPVKWPPSANVGIGGCASPQPPIPAILNRQAASLRREAGRPLA